MALDIDTLLPEVTSAEIVVGIPSFNNARTIPHVVRTAVEGLASYFLGRKSLVLISDGGSPDQTAAVAVDAATRALDSLDPASRKCITVAAIQYRGLSGKGSAFRDIFEGAARLGASAVVLLDADLRSVDPAWIGRLAGPITTGEADYVAPLYRRHRFDGTITNSIVYPLTDAVFGGAVRQPIGGDFGVSGQLARLYASKDVWSSDVARFGVDLWMTTTALAEGFRVAQTHLGVKVHDAKDPGQHLAAMLAQVVGTAFTLLETYASTWTLGVRADPSPTLGAARPGPLDPVHVDVRSMEEQFRFGAKELVSIYRNILPDQTLEGLLDAASTDHPEITGRLWARTVIHYAIAFHRRVLARDQLVRSLTPLYLGRTASFVRQNMDRPDEDVEADVRALALEFADAAHLLHRLWKEEL